MTKHRRIKRQSLKLVLAKSETAMLAIKQAKADAQAAYIYGAQALESLTQIRICAVSIIDSQPASLTLSTLVRHIDRKIELIRSAELGALTIEVNRAMEEAFQNLP